MTTISLISPLIISRVEYLIYTEDDVKHNYQTSPLTQSPINIIPLLSVPYTIVINYSHHCLFFVLLDFVQQAKLEIWWRSGKCVSGNTWPEQQIQDKDSLNAREEEEQWQFNKRHYATATLNPRINFITVYHRTVPVFSTQKWYQSKSSKMNRCVNEAKSEIDTLPVVIYEQRWVIMLISHDDVKNDRTSNSVFTKNNQWNKYQSSERQQNFISRAMTVVNLAQFLVSERKRNNLINSNLVPAISFFNRTPYRYLMWCSKSIRPGPVRD